MQDPFDDGLKALNNLGVTEHLALETAAADGACTGQDIAVDVAAADRASGTKAAGHLTASHAVSCLSLIHIFMGIYFCPEIADFHLIQIMLIFPKKTISIFV